MTISRSIRKRLRRYALLCLVTATSAGFVETAQTSKAEDTHDSSDLCGWVEDLSQTTFSKESVAIRRTTSQASAPQFLSVSAADELTIDTCNFDTWLAGVLSPSENESAITEQSVEQDAAIVATPTASRTSSQFNSTLATIAAAASAGNPIPLSQWTEPFAMIGPDGSHPPQEIKAFQEWYENGKAFVAGLRTNAFSEFVPVVDFDGEVADPASDALVARQSSPAVPAAKTSPLIGSSPFIATIEEAYQPYDLAAEDLPESTDVAETDVSQTGNAPATDEPKHNEPDNNELVWTGGLFSPSLQPFCIHSLDLLREPGWSPLARHASPATEPNDPSPAAEAVADVEQPEPVTEPEALVAEAVAATPTLEPSPAAKAVAEVEQPEPVTEPEARVAEAVAATPALEPSPEAEAVADVEQPEPVTEPEALVAEAVAATPALEPSPAAEAVADVEQPEPVTEPEALVAKTVAATPAVEPSPAAEAVADVEQPEPVAEPEALVAEAVAATPAVEPSPEAEAIAEVEQPEPVAEPEALVAEAVAATPAVEPSPAAEAVADVEQPEPVTEPEALVAKAVAATPTLEPSPEAETVADVAQPEASAEPQSLVAASPPAPQEAKMADEAPGFVGSPDCLLEDVIWQVSVAMEDAKVADQWLRPKRIGKRLASLVVGGDQVASRVASELALVWPANAQPAKPIPGTGAKLLARAEAAEQLPAEGTAKPFTPEQLAQADAMLWQWVDVAQSVIDDLSDRLHDVTEVALHRGTQDESNRR